MTTTKTISTGEPSTLKTYRTIALALFGEGPATSFIDDKIRESPDGENEFVGADERQMMMLLADLSRG